MGDAYPELRSSKDRVADVLRQEEERFAETLENGMEVLESALASGEKLLDGDTVFKLYDTYGFPVDLTADICRERGVLIDMAGFEAAMEQQRSRARAASRFSAAAGLEYSGGKTEFHGYDTLVLPAKIVALYREGAQVQSLKSGDVGAVVLDRTPFYAESGGQVGDRGELVGSAGTFEVADTQKIQADVYGHEGTMKTGALKVGADREHAEVGGLATVLELAAGDRLPVPFDDHQTAGGGGDDLAHPLRIGALPAEDVGLRGPARTARFPAVRRLDQRDESRYVGLGRVAVGELGRVPGRCGVHGVAPFQRVRSARG